MWLENVIRKSAWELERTRKTIFMFNRSIQDVLGKYPVQEWETAAWARGLKTGLIRLEGYFFRVGSGKRSPLSFFVRNANDLYVGLRRESVTQAATYVTLVTDYGYPRNRTRFESLWMDVAVVGPEGKAWIYAENKASQKTLEKLCNRLSSEFHDVDYRGSPREARGPAISEARSAKPDDAVMKAQHIMKNRPRYFWAVCPTSRACFEIQYRQSGGFGLDLIPNLPNALDWTN